MPAMAIDMNTGWKYKNTDSLINDKINEYEMEK